MKCLECDDSGHWYVIDVEQRTLFNQLLEEDRWEEFDVTFDIPDVRLNRHISSYCFDNFQEIPRELP